MVWPMPIPVWKRQDFETHGQMWHILSLTIWDLRFDFLSQWYLSTQSFPCAFNNVHYP